MLFRSEVALVYLASHVLLNEKGDPFQEIMNELSTDEASVYARYTEQRRYQSLTPKDAAAARQFLLEIVDRATEPLRTKAAMLRELAELDAAEAADRLSWDDTAEGERLRRYELTCNRTLLRLFELLLKVRRTGEELDLRTIASFGRSLPTGTMGAIDRPTPADATVITPPAEPVRQPDPPIEANPVREQAPNEANLHAQAHSISRQDGHKDFRIDTPHLDRNAGGIGITGNGTIHPAIRRLQTGRDSTLLDLSSIFGK